MAMIEAKSEYQKAFTARTKQAREARYTQDALANILGIFQDTYKQYEKRTLLPHYMISKFCAACGITEKWLLTGKGQRQVTDTRQAAA